MVEVTTPAARPAGSVKRAAAAVLAAASVVAAAACGTADAAAGSLVGEEFLTIGVQTDQPGLGRQIPGAVSGRYDSYDGFDVTVAKELARNLGFPARKVSFSPVPSEKREEAIVSGEVDLVVGSYSITPERKTMVGFAGPYYVAHQDILVRKANPASIRNLHDLGGKRLCSVAGSQSFHRVRTEQSVSAVPVQAKGYTDCLNKLIAGELDAVSTDDLILAGLASMAAKTGDYMKLVNEPFSDERYGVGLEKDDVDGCEAVNEAITKMYQDDTVRLQLNRWFGPTGLELTTTVPQFEGCI
ncbi:glutamate ABC transporter substrate-binding protein [Spirillospora sp. NPDC048819]|uniref:glutamate ABC transporter substrate-binding protein n=1 Tax=Spirillospora sp. NPDC048819 TaxID=3155268 RepID=UPI0033C0644E